MSNYVNVPVIDSTAIGATIIFETDAVPGYYSRQHVTGVIADVRDSRTHGHYLVVESPVFNLPKVIREDQIRGWMHPTMAAALEGVA